MQHLTKNIQPTKEIMIVKARGDSLWDANGKHYIDFSSQTLNLSLGQSHPELIKTVSHQLEQFTFLSTRFINQSFIKLSEKLVALAPQGLNKINLKLTNGSDANESAFKRVRKYRNKRKIVSLNTSHLGETSETICASGKHFDNRTYIRGSDDFYFVDPPHADFFPNANKSQVEVLSIDQIKQLLLQDKNIAAIVVEPIMVNAGAYILPISYLTKLRSLCDRYAVSLIFDEIQTCGGWLGNYFVSTKLGITPDIITLGKALSPGFPLAGILMKPEYDVLDYGEDEFTYGGHPVSIAVALKTLELLQTIATPAIISEKEKAIRDEIQKLQNEFPFIVEIRGMGMIWAFALDSGNVSCSASNIYDMCLENGLILRKSQDGHGSSLVIKPSLIISQSDLKEGLKRLRTTLGESHP